MMKPFAAIALVAVLLAGGAYALMRSVPRTSNAVAAAGSSCDGAAPANGAALGNYDAAMSGSCRFSCAAREPYCEADVVAQPDVKPGELTRCPVSGVVFHADDQHPRVRLAGHEYVFCCDNCEKKFRADPAHYVSL